MTADDIDVRHLRPALEYVVLIAEQLHNKKGAPAVPPKLKKYYGNDRQTTAALRSIRRIVEAEPEFREAIGAHAPDELVDELGKCWLERTAGWQAKMLELLAAAEREKAEAELAVKYKRAEKRRLAAEKKLADTVAEKVTLLEAHDRAVVERNEAKIDRQLARDERDAMRQQLIEARNEARHAHDREQAALRRAERAEQQAATANSTRRRAEVVRDNAIAQRRDAVADQSELNDIARTAMTLAARLHAVTAPVEPGDQRQQRQALAMPGGVLGSSLAATKFLFNSGAAILIDGYNVSKLVWSTRSLEQQRNMLHDHLDNVARRFGSDLTVVWDGSDVPGAHAAGRRLVRVMFSPPDVTADDVLRDEVDRVPSVRPVVVITNDKEIVRDVKAKGANVLASDQLIELLS